MPGGERTEEPPEETDASEEQEFGGESAATCVAAGERSPAMPAKYEPLNGEKPRWYSQR